MDYQALPPVDVYLMCEPEAAVPLLLEAVEGAHGERAGSAGAEAAAARQRDAVSMRGVARRARTPPRKGMRRLLHAPAARLERRLHAISAIRSTISAPKAARGVGSGPGITVGAALALKGSGRLPIGLLGDGDFLMAQHRGVDRGALPDSVPDDRLQQPLVLQRRAAPGARRRTSAAARRRTAGSASASATPTSISRRWRARRARSASARSRARPTFSRRSTRASRSVRKGGVCVIDARVLPGYDAEGG